MTYEILFLSGEDLNYVEGLFKNMGFVMSSGKELERGDFGASCLK
ncbi:MAG: hypothetical protein ABEK17_04005 [Candidatus Aenigmatarchaeota archaeon]